MPNEFTQTRLRLLAPSMADQMIDHGHVKEAAELLRAAGLHHLAEAVASSEPLEEETDR